MTLGKEYLLDAKVLVSACLAGVNCRYNGSNTFCPEMVNELESSELIICCPELLGGLPTPRTPCNICGEDGVDVINGTAKIVGNDGKDYTEYYIEGALKALEIAKKHKITKVFLQQRSPSCGCGQIYTPDAKSIKQGDGVFTALLKQNLPDVEIIAV